MSTKLYYRDSKSAIICENMLFEDLIPQNHIDLIITSPPYNLSKEYYNCDDELNYDEYLQFTEQWLKKSLSLAKDDGRLCLNIPLDTGRGQIRCTGPDIIEIAKKVGWKYRSGIIWNKGTVSGSHARGSIMSARSPHIIAPVELIIVMYKNRWRKDRVGTSDVTQEEFFNWTNGLWTFHGENKKEIGHPAPFPVELPKRCIKLFSYTDDIILDPFMGSGTTLIAANMLGRKAYGIDISREYCELAMNRLLKL